MELFILASVFFFWFGVCVGLRYERRFNKGAVREFLIETLLVLEREIPPPAKQHHSIHFYRFSDDGTYSPELAITVLVDGIRYSFVLEDDDFTTSTPIGLAAEIINQVVVLEDE